jgi:hypothetical protein
MVNFYVLQIRLGNIGIDDVPERWREEVVVSCERDI